MSAPRRPLRKTTTLRLEPVLHERLVELSKHLKQPVSKLIDEALSRFVDARSASVEADLQKDLQRLRALRERDPRFERAIERFVSAEFENSDHDAAEGQPTAVGPLQTEVRELLRG